MRIIIKCKFLAPNSHIYGILLIIFDEETLHFEGQLINLSTYSLEYNSITPDSSIEGYLDIINKKRNVMSFQTIALRLQVAIEKNLNIYDKNEKGIRRKDSIEIEDFLKTTIRKCVVEREIIIFTALEEVSSERYTKLFLKKETQESVAENVSEESYENVELRIPEGGIEMKSSLILAPVDGKPIFNLKVGDSIFVEVKEEYDEDTPSRRSVKPAIISGIQFLDGVHTFLLSLGGNEYSLVEESENIKLKVFSGDHAKVQEEKKEKQSIKTPLTLIFVSLFFILVIFFFFLAYIWVI